jgi:hypothetical protein
VPTVIENNGECQKEKNMDSEIILDSNYFIYLTNSRFQIVDLQNGKNFTGFGKD